MKNKLRKFLKKSINSTGWLLENISWTLRILFHLSEKEQLPCEITIGVVTFLDRYNNCFVPLLSKLAVLFSDSQVIVIANGHVKHDAQKDYLNQISRFCEQFHNVSLIPFLEPHGLSFLWNLIIKNSQNDLILILNDDIKIKKKFKHFLHTSGILSQEIATINRSWSHFLISKSIISLVGWFDECLKEIGGEDDDYSARLAMKLIAIPDFSTKTIAGKLGQKKKRLTINSYGKNMNLERLGYSTYNSEYLEKKWQTSSYIFPGAIEVPNRRIKYWKLKDSSRKMK